MDKLKASLVIATLGRVNEVRELLVSLTAQTISKNLFEVIVVDQNEDNVLKNIVLEFDDLLNINHQRVNFRGLAKAKNFGILHSKNQIISFPDDDCAYYPDTLEKVFQFFEIYPNRQLVYGKLYDRASSKNIMRNWLKHPCIINYFNFPKTYCAITLFANKNIQNFDEQFGWGQNMGLERSLITYFNR